MAKNALSEFLALADSVREAQDLLDRHNSLAQAIKEAEARLSKLRDLEATARADFDVARKKADEVKQAAEDKALGLQTQTSAEASAIISTAKVEAYKILDAAKSQVSALEHQGEQIARHNAQLEAKEDVLAKRVASLKADINALRERLG